MENTRLSKHFTLEEFINTQKYPCNKPTLQHVANMVYGCVMLLEPARQVVGPILVNSGFRNEDVNRHVGGVKNSQHLTGQPASGRLPKKLGVHRPTPDRQRLAPHLLVSFQHAPPLCSDRIL